MEANTLKIEFRESRVGSEMLVINGYKYMINRRSGDTVYWRCIFSWCHSRAVIKAGQLKSARGTHVCPQLQQSETKNAAEVECQVATTPNISIQSVFSMNDSHSDYHTPTCDPPNQSLNVNQNEVFEFEGLEAIGMNGKPASNFDDNASTECSFSTANSSFLEFVEDKSFLPKAEVSEEELCKADAAWKKRILANLKVYSKAEQLRRFNIAYNNRKSWCENRKHFSERLSGCQKKWANSNATWTYSKDWPTRSHCMKLTKPERGVGVFVEQPLVPIKIIDEVRAIPNYVYLGSQDENVDNKKSFKTKRALLVSDNESTSKMTKINEDNLKQVKNEGKCAICGKVFQSNLERHMNVHYGIKPFKCEYCNKMFSQEHSYRAHIRIHTKDKPFSCTICPKNFTSNGTLKRHIKSHSNGRTFSCNTCGKRFRKAEFLHLHSFKCHPEDSKTGSIKILPSIQTELKKEETITVVASSLKRKRIMPRKFEEGCEEPSLSKKTIFVERELRKGKQLIPGDHTYCNGEAVSTTQQITLEELK